MGTPEDLWTIIQNKYQKKFPHKKISPFVKTIIHSWITKKYYPTLEIRNITGNLTALIRNSDKFIYDLDNNKTETWIPVTYTTQSSPDFNNNTFFFEFNNDSLFWLTSENLRHIIPGIKKSDWFIVNIQQIGKY